MSVVLRGRDVIVVSAMGRGLMVAALLRAAGFSVTLVDVTAQLGVWPLEDIEGPFGLLRPEGIDLNLQELFSHSDPLVSVDQGFTVWTSEGPWESRGPLNEFRHETLGWSRESYECLVGGDSSIKLRGLEDFPRSWILGFVRRYFSTVHREPLESLAEGAALSLANTFYIRHPSRQGVQNSLQWLESRGVEVITRSKIIDVFEKTEGGIGGVELSGDRAGLLSSDYVLWTLTSAETYYLANSAGEKIFPRGEVDGIWCWIRYRVQMPETPAVHRLPAHCVMVQDHRWPWVHENMMALIRTPLPHMFDVWVQVPNLQRFNKDYLRKQGASCVAFLSDRLCTDEVFVQSWPQEFSYTYEELGPPRFPVWERQPRFRKIYHNLFISSPEVWESYLVRDQLLVEDEAVGKIASDRAEVEARRRKNRRGKQE
ncbi:MAG: hypothetical protein N2578_01675 [Bdellovibrionaceae bacterium]|nr:hypothetical protein [Pseudobdellovibrionaceae bacterium]